MYDNRPSKYPAVFRTYVRIPDYVELDNAEELADAIIREVVLKEAWLTRVLGNSADPDASVGKWDRRRAQCGGMDERSSGVQETYLSPNGQLVLLVVYIDAEWMDEQLLRYDSGETTRRSLRTSSVATDVATSLIFFI